MNGIGSCKDVIVIPKATTKKSLKIYSKINDKEWNGGLKNVYLTWKKTTK